MYLPLHFREERPEVLHDFIERHPLATLVTSIDGDLNADHLPMLLDRRRGARATLLGHVARGNALWRRVSDGTQVLAIFSGADSYVSPSWYPSKAVTGQVVPTWNYSVVHVHGQIRFFDDASRLRALVSTLTDHHERSRPEPWSVNDAPAPYVEAQLRAIVGFEIEILEAVGKFKASQNRAAEDRAGVHAALSQSLDADDVAELIRAPRPSRD